MSTSPGELRASVVPHSDWDGPLETVEDGPLEPVEDFDGPEFQLKSPPLKEPFSYIKNPLSSAIRRTKDGDLVGRSIVGSKNDFKKVQASKFLSKLNDLKL